VNDYYVCRDPYAEPRPTSFHIWHGGEIALLDGRIVQVKKPYTNAFTPVPGFTQVYYSDGSHAQASISLLAPVDLLTMIVVDADNPFVWWKRWPRRLRYLFSPDTFVC